MSIYSGVIKLLLPVITFSKTIFLVKPGVCSRF